MRMRMEKGRRRKMRSGRCWRGRALARAGAEKMMYVGGSAFNS
jgi:hypothetical protein